MEERCRDRPAQAEVAGDAGDAGRVQTVAGH